MVGHLSSVGTYTVSQGRWRFRAARGQCLTAAHVVDVHPTRQGRQASPPPLPRLATARIGFMALDFKV